MGDLRDEGLKVSIIAQAGLDTLRRLHDNGHDVSAEALALLEAMLDAFRVADDSLNRTVDTTRMLLDRIDAIVNGDDDAS